MPPPPELMEEVVEEILVRFPPDDPASLARAALVCKPWCRLVSGTAFRRRFREFHQHRRGPALLGVLYTRTTAGMDDDRDADDGTDVRCTKRARILQREPKPTACFVPTTASFRSGPAHHAASSRLRYGWRAIDARHGRVLLRRSGPSTYGRGLSVWDPVMDELRDLPEPSSFNELMLGYHWTAAVVCAATAGGICDHLDCHRGPFLVVVMDVQAHVIYRSVYSSQAAAWSRLEALKRPDPTFPLGEFRQTPSVLIGSTLHFLVHFNDEIIGYDLATHDVSAIDVPPEFHGLLEQRGVVLVIDNGGGLGFVANTNKADQHQVELWSRVVNGGEQLGDFVQTRLIDLHSKAVLSSSGTGAAGAAALISNSLRVNGFGFAAATCRFLFMRMSDGLYSIELNSNHVSKIADDCCGHDDVVPYISFCTPNSFQI